jgi:hypothetical protein
VLHGGHSITDRDILRRFPRSLYNLFNLYAREVDYTQCFLNTGTSPQLVFIQQGEERTLIRPNVYQRLLEQARPEIKKPGSQAMNTLSPKDQRTLDILRRTAIETLDRKRSLGHYAVVWHDGQVMKIDPGHDSAAPQDIPNLPPSFWPPAELPAEKNPPSR